ncbi:MAG: AMP-binding protein, partial [Planctomycetota bacterium]
MTAPTTVWGLLVAGVARDPGATSIVSEGAPIDHRSLLETAELLAAALRAKGVGNGDRVAIMERNSPAFLIATFAVAGVGAVLVPLNLRLAARELRATLEDAGAALVLAHVEFRGVIEGATDAPIAWIGPRGEGGRPFGLELSTSGAAAPFLPAPLGPDDVAHLYYTSGTTGRPKGVPLTHGNVTSHALAATTELDLDADDVWGHIAPMFHLADAWATLAVTAVGGSHAFLPRFDAADALALFEERGVTVTNLVPVMLQRILDAARRQAFDGGSLRLVLSGGAPIAPATVRAVLDVLRCEYVQTYGLTETSPYLTLALLEPRHRALDPDAQLARRSRTGRAFETVELDVVDEDGRPVPRDDATVGEIVARGSTVTPGYWNRPEETAAAFRDGWFRTGDLATIDDEGWVDIVDRAKDVIITGGENVYSIEVENALYEHPAVLECAAFGVPSEEWGEELRAAVVLSGDADEEELRGHCRERIAGYKVPRRVLVLDELPKTGSGK